MNRIILADLHFDSDPLTEYRWDIFYNIKRIISKYTSIDFIDILGDLTEKKDKHDSALVNRITYHLQDLVGTTHAKVRILMGNHDYINEDEPFFEFLNQIDGVYFISHPLKNGDTFFIPNSKNLVIPNEGLEGTNFLYLHQPFKGSVAQGGFILQEGADPSLVENLSCTIYSGDIHSPQKVGNINYVGAPYHVYFGDNYDGRAIVISHNKVYSEPLVFPKRHSVIIRKIGDLDLLNFNNGDQIKFKIELEKTKFHLWDTWKGIVRDFCTDKGLNLVSTELKPLYAVEELKILNSDGEYVIKDSKEIIDRFAENEKLTDEFVEIAYEVVNETEKAKNKRV